MQYGHCKPVSVTGKVRNRKLSWWSTQVVVVVVVVVAAVAVAVAVAAVAPVVVVVVVRWGGKFYHQTTFMIVNKQLAKKLLKSTELDRSYSPPKLARFFLNHSVLYRPRNRKDERLSWPSWLVTYRGGLPVHRRSLILALTGSDIAQLRWSRPTCYH